MLLLGGIIILAAILRLYRLGDESMWLDEAMMMERISGSYFNLLIDWDSNRQGPLFTFIQKAWCDCCGTGDATARIPAMIFGVLSVPAVFLLGRRLFGTQAGLWAALFTAINPFAVFFAQEARPYTLYLLVSVLSLYFWIRLVDGFSWRRAWLFLVTTLAVLYTHQFGPFLIIAYAMLLLLSRRFTLGLDQQPRGKLMKVLAMVVILYIPQMLRFGATFVMKVIDPTIAGAWIQVPGFGALLDALRQYFMYPGLAIAAYVVILVALIVAFRKRTKPGLGFWTIAVVLFSVLFLPWLISLLITPIFIPKYCIPAAGIILITLGWAFTQLKMPLRIAALLVIISLSVVPLDHLYSDLDKDPIRQTAQYITGQMQAGDVVITESPWSALALQHYFPPTDSVRLTGLLNVQDLNRAIRKAQRVWLVEAYTAKSAPHEELTAALSKRGAQELLININESRKANPYGFHIEPYIVTRYNLATSSATLAPTAD